MLERPLADTLRLVAAAMADAADPWWIIGSAAVRLHGIETSVADVDLLAGAGDMARLCDRWRIVARSGIPDGRFRSRSFASWTGAPLRVEIMAGLQVTSADGWISVAADGARTVRHGDIPVPDRDRLVDILRLFGRLKDMERAAGLMADGSS